MTNLFYADRLRKVDDNPLPQQTQTPPPPEEINGEPEFEAKWKGCDPDETWYSAANFKNAPIVVERFHTEHPEVPGLPVRLQEWIRAAATDEIDEDHPDDNKAEKAGTGPTRKKRHL
ncbi:hypothetical protein DL764_010265 [Monosporascus ibericus]|uniref:Chromo domain-containing protein n=1 Tax=Monosporascus ibericus TaxID=155417 RepID=A0A4Q4SV85_9PEZI|nr:hypothetical protein DL764_010265 [Monosporascus ibericus]